VSEYRAEPSYVPVDLNKCSESGYVDLTTYVAVFIQPLASGYRLTQHRDGSRNGVAPADASGTKQSYEVGSQQLPLLRLSHRSATPQKPHRADATVIQNGQLDSRHAWKWRPGGKRRPTDWDYNRPFEPPGAPGAARKRSASPFSSSIAACRSQTVGLHCRGPFQTAKT
jgi:hypothetical protein